MLPVHPESHVLLQWDSQFLRMSVVGALDEAIAAKIVRNCIDHAESLPFGRILFDLLATDDHDASALRSMARGLSVLQAMAADDSRHVVQAECFFMVEESGLRKALQDCGLLRDGAEVGASERDAEAWVRHGSAQHRKRLAAVNVLAEAPTRFSFGGWLRDVATPI